MKIIELIQGSEPWLQYRRNKISATDSGIILGLNPWVTPYQLWQRKLGLIEEQPINNKMREGSLMEEQARQFINRVHKTDCKPIVALSSDYDFMMASLDGVDSNGNIWEIKCGKASHELAKQNIIPEYYNAQLQKQMFVANKDTAYYFSYRSDTDNILLDVDRDDDFIEKMIEAEKKFYDCLMNFTAPELIDSDYVIKDDPESKCNAEEYLQAKRNREHWEKQEDALRERLIKSTGGLISKLPGLTISKSMRRGNVDYSAIPELKSIDLNKYRKKPSEVWTIREI